MKPTDALLYRRILQEMCEAAPEAGTLDGWTKGHAGLWADWLPDTEVYYVSAEMTAIARAAGRQMPRQELQADDVPSPCGFLVFDQPITHADLSDAVLPIRGVAWSTAEQWTGDDDAGTGHWAHGIEVLVLFDASVHERGPTALLPAAQLAWPIGESPANAHTVPYREDIVGIILATWTLMQQSLTVTVRSHADRAEQRRWFRRRTEPPTILIVRLRRLSPEGSEDDTGEGSPRHWSHRWLVGGHWRNQWLPSRNAHRLQWISPYVKGPSSLPLLVKDRVTAWTR